MTHFNASQRDAAPQLIVATPDQLAELIRDAVAEALAEQSQDVAAALLDRNGIARALGVSPSTVDKLRREALPYIMLGDSPRFEPAACIEWLRENRAGGRS